MRAKKSTGSCNLTIIITPGDPRCAGTLDITATTTISTTKESLCQPIKLPNKLKSS